MQAAAKQQGCAPYHELAATALGTTLAKDTLMTLAEDLSASCFAFKTHPTFRRTEGVDALRRVMAAYLGRNPGGYFRYV
jgi:hypothetical protein